MAMKVLAKCMSSKGRVGATGISTSYRGLTKPTKPKGYATVNNTETENLWSRKPKGTPSPSPQVPTWNSMMNAARDALDNSSIPEDEKEAVLEDLQRRVDKKPKNASIRNEIRLHFTMAIQKDDVPAALKTFAVTTRLTDPGRTVKDIMKDVSVALDEHVVDVEGSTKVALLARLKRSLVEAKTAEQRRAITGEIYKALRQSDALAELQEITSAPIQKTTPSTDADREDVEQAAEASDVANPDIFMDIAHLQRSLPLPTKDDYPGKKNLEALLAPVNIANTIDNYCGRKKLRKIAKTKLESRTYPPDTGPSGINNKTGCQVWTCHLRFAIPGLLDEENVVGQGLNRQSAKHAAYLQILSKLHVGGGLAELFTKPGAKKQETPIPKAPVKVEVEVETPAEQAVPSSDCPFPTKEEYPTAPADLWVAKTISSVIHNACQKHKFSLETQGEYLKGKPPRYELKLNIPGILTQNAIGTGATLKLAKVDSWSEMVKRLHASGHLQQLFPGTDSKMNPVKPRLEQLAEEIELVTIDDRTMKAEKDAKLEIYNYAASYGFVPEFEVKHVVPRTRRSRVGQVMKKSRPAVQVSIKLSQLGIEVTSAGKDLSTAEVAAALSFKRQAESMRSAENDENVPSPVAGLETLNVETAPVFFDFYRSVKQGVFLDLEHQSVSIAGVSQNSTSVTINGIAVGASVTMVRKKDSTAVAYLCAALEILKMEPELIPGFAEVMRDGKGKMLRLQRPISAPIAMNTLDMMRETLVNARRAGLPDEREPLGAEETRSDARFGRRGITVSTAARNSASELLLAAQQRFERDPSLETLRSTKASLPMSQYRSQVIEIAEHLYSIIIGATGSGKTTQVPQILLEDAISRGEGGMCDIICTQPRRLAATSVAQRVAAERNEPLQQSVGYQVRFDAKLPKPAGSITYCTTGILLEQLKHDADGIMDRVSHLVIDEVHERDLNIDFLLIILKKAIKARREAGKPVPKVILMSATLDAKLFAEYLTRDADRETIPCPSLSVPGRTFPVKERYLQDVLDEIKKANGRELDSLLQTEKPAVSLDYLDAEFRFASGMVEASTGASSGIDWKRERKTDAEDDTQESNEKEDGLVPVPLLAATIAHICNTSQDDGAILAFLPGLAEISRTEDILMRQSIFGVDFCNPAKFKIHALHSQVPPQQQNEVLERPAPGCRKIILSTNIAETSITVPDVKHVIDLGKLRESRYDQLRRITKLQTVWESNSNAKQRAGRAGRVQEGNYYGLYSRERRSAMPAAGLPELLRSDLQTTCLSIKAQGFEQSVSSFLDEAIESPPRAAVTSALENLKSISALTSDEKLTSLGRVLSKLPVHPSLGKMILLGVIFRCLDPMLVLGSMDGERSLFVQPMAARTQAKAAHNRFNTHNSDHLALLEAFRTLRRFKSEVGMFRANQYAHDNFLHTGAFKSIDSTAQQIEQILQESGIIAPSPRYNNHDSGLEFGGPELNRNSTNPMLIKCLFLAGVNPNIGVKNAGKTQVHRTGNEQGVLLHPGSLNFSRGPAAEEERLYAFSTLAKSVAGETLFMRDATVITPLMAMLFGGRLELKSHNTKSIEMEGWLPFRFEGAGGGRVEYTARLVLEFRKGMERVLGGAFKKLSTRDGGGGRGGVGGVGQEEEESHDEVREYFTSQVAEILKTQDLDGAVSRGREAWVPAGWGMQQQQQQGGNGGGGGDYRS